ncbi:MAG: FtsX-like permease family protein, partial [Caldilineaceae bacterium]|nr:FtsX-like permease family protein [Caldilineaceae bacterium]
WVVVGVVRVIGNAGFAYVPYEYFTHTAGNVDRASQAQIVTTDHDAATVDALSKELEAAFENAGIQVTQTQTVAWIREQNEFYFQIIVVLLLIMSVMIAAVGALGLAGTMSINVLERTREIGVMRAIGASNRSVRNIVLTEGVLIGLISWGVGALIAFPLGRLMSDGVGFAFFQMPLSYAFAYDGIVLWLVIVLVLSAVASMWPARNAARLTVRETLAYE